MHLLLTLFLSALTLISCTDNNTNESNANPYQSPNVLTINERNNCPSNAAGPLGNSWCWAIPSPQGNTIRDMDFGDGRFAFVGDNATLITSPDLQSFKNYNLSDQFLFPFYDVAFSEDKLTVSHPGGTYTTTDYITWKKSDIHFSALSLHYAEGIWVASGISNSIAVSSDGYTWKEYPLPIPEELSGLIHFNKIYHANGKWIVAGSKGLIFTSEDSTTWAASAHRLPIDIHDIVYAKHLDEWIAVGYPDIAFEDINDPRTKQINAIVSKDTHYWSVVETPATYGLKSISYDGVQILASPGLEKYFTTSDGRAWQSHGERSALFDTYHAHRFINEEQRWVAAGTGGRILSSTNADSWVSHVKPLLDKIEDIHYSPEAGFLAVGGTSEYEGGILISQDGITWNLQLVPNASIIDDATWIEGTWVISDFSGNILSSPDGVLWTNIHRSINKINNVSFDPISGRGIAVGNQGTILMTDNLTHWQPQISPSSSNINAVHFANGQWVAVGDTGIYYSDTGERWQQADISDDGTGNFKKFEHLNFFNGKWLAFRGTDDLFYSENGIDWHSKRITSANITSSFIAQDVIRVTTLSGTLYESIDGLTWKETDLSMNLDWDSGITFNGNRWFITSSDGSIRFSND